MHEGLLKRLRQATRPKHAVGRVLIDLTSSPRPPVASRPKPDPSLRRSLPRLQLLMLKRGADKIAFTHAIPEQLLECRQHPTLGLRPRLLNLRLGTRITDSKPAPTSPLLEPPHRQPGRLLDRRQHAQAPLEPLTPEFPRALDPHPGTHLSHRKDPQHHPFLRAVLAHKEAQLKTRRLTARIQHHQRHLHRLRRRPLPLRRAQSPEPVKDRIPDLLTKLGILDLPDFKDHHLGVVRSSQRPDLLRRPGLPPHPRHTLLLQSQKPPLQTPR